MLFIGAKFLDVKAISAMADFMMTDMAMAAIGSQQSNFKCNRIAVNEMDHRRFAFTGNDQIVFRDRRGGLFFNQMEPGDRPAQSPMAHRPSISFKHILARETEKFLK